TGRRRRTWVAPPRAHRGRPPPHHGLRAARRLGPRCRRRAAGGRPAVSPARKLGMRTCVAPSRTGRGPDSGSDDSRQDGGESTVRHGARNARLRASRGWGPAARGALSLMAVALTPLGAGHRVEAPEVRDRPFFRRFYPASRAAAAQPAAPPAAPGPP